MKPPFLLALLVMAVTRSVFAAFPTLYLQPVVLHQLNAPTNIVNAGDGTGRLFVADQPGRIFIVHKGMMLPTPFLDITDRTVTQGSGYSERGLLGLVFHPGYEDDSSPGYRKFYVYYSKPYVAGTDPGPPQVGDPVNHVGVLAEFQASASDPNVALPASERRLMVFTEPQSNHNGGQLEFGPDGFLYFGLGDGGGQNDNDFGHTDGSAAKPAGVLGNAQDLTRIYGKILRIDPLGSNGPEGQYGIPADNPFVGLGGGTREEIWALGLRNPWRFSFDKRAGGTHRLFCADVGQNKVEEVNIISKGGNFGWRIREGSVDHDATSPNPSGIALSGPVAEYAHPGASGVGAMPQLGFSITGGYVYRGAAIPALQGKYVFGDYGAISTAASARLMGLEETSPGSGVFTLTQAIPLLGGAAYNPMATRVLCFGEDESGELYMGAKTTSGVLAQDSGLPSGGLFKIVAAPALTTITVGPTKDNSIYSELPSNSNATGDLFAGRIAIGGGNRRALLAFNPGAALPPRTPVVTASLALNVSMVATSNPGPTDMTLHRVNSNESWGEGTSFGLGQGGTASVGDATWTNRQHPSTAWATAGGSFSSTASATASVNDVGPYSWSSAQMAAEVQGWLVSPSTNNGWLLRGNELVNASAKRFDSRESSATADRPKLSLGYVPLSRFDTWLGAHFPTHRIGQYIDLTRDDDNDHFMHLAEYAYGFNPLASDPPNSGMSTAAAPDGSGGTNLTIAFRRDPLATDLTYRLQVSSDLSEWSLIAESTAGATATGSGVLSDSPISGQSPYRLVTVAYHDPPGGPSAYFFRLHLIWNP